MGVRSGYPVPISVKSAAILFFLVFLFSCVYGCEPKTKSHYKMLSFFFDGVPDPEAPGRENGKEGGTENGVSRRAKASYKEHGPFAAKMCDGCHERSTNVLILPVERLCLNCHVINVDKKYLHGPLSAGGCKVCHDPHGSAFPYLLVSEPAKFCMYCHDEKDIARNEAHKGTTEGCTKCHDAHMSDNNYLLK